MQLKEAKVAQYCGRFLVQGRKLLWLAVLLAAFWALAFSAAHASDHYGGSAIPNLRPFADASGEFSTFSTTGVVNETGPFFQSLGTNGRECVTCHEPSDAMSITVPDIRERFEESRGADPLFATVDGANCPDDARDSPDSHSLLLNHGLIRIGIQLPANPQFTIKVIHDPYGCAVTTDPTTGAVTISVYRRPLPATNLRFLSTVMFDGRETVEPLTSQQTFAANLMTDLEHQAADAVTGHAQALSAPSDEILKSIADFEIGLFTGQASNRLAGSLHEGGAAGGAQNLSEVSYFPGINDPLGGNPSGVAFNSSSMTLFSAWAQTPASSHYFWSDPQSQSREDIAAGEQIFDTFPLTITEVRGLNDNASLGNPPAIAGTCTTCHDTPNVGNHSLPVPLDIGSSHTRDYETDPLIANALSQLDSSDLPIFEISGCPDPFDPGQTTLVFTSDPGKALVSGACSDLNRGKGPILRGLAGRAPYFHNGAAANLQQLVNFYNLRFQMNLTEKEKQQLIAFLNSL